MSLSSGPLGDDFLLFLLDPAGNGTLSTLGKLLLQASDTRLLVSHDYRVGEKVGRYRRREAGKKTANQVRQEHAVPEPEQPLPMRPFIREDRREVTPEIVRGLAERAEHQR